MRYVPNHHRETRKARRLGMESLEGRRLLAVDLDGVVPSLDDSVTPTAIHQNPYNVYDATDDGGVNVIDIHTMVSYLRTVIAAPPGQPRVAPPANSFLDITGDGVVHIADLAELASEVRRLIQLPVDEPRFSSPRLKDGVLWVPGTRGTEDLSCDQEETELVVRIGDAQNRAKEFRFDYAAVMEIRYRGYGGDDSVVNNTDLALREFLEEGKE